MLYQEITDGAILVVITYCGIIHVFKIFLFYLRPVRHYSEPAEMRCSEPAEMRCSEPAEMTTGRFLGWSQSVPKCAASSKIASAFKGFSFFLHSGTLLLPELLFHALPFSVFNGLTFFLLPPPICMQSFRFICSNVHPDLISYNTYRSMKNAEDYNR
jgi:hypothetical protein